MSTSSLITRGIAVAAAWVLPAVAFAQTNTGPDTGNVKKIVEDTKNILNTVLVLLFVLALLVFAWGIVKYITSANNPEKEKEARKFLWWGVIGIFVLASVLGLVSFIGKYFGVGQGAGNINVPGVQGNAQ